MSHHHAKILFSVTFITLVLSIPSQAGQTADQILESQSLGEIFNGKNIWGAGSLLFQELEREPDEERVWRALYHYQGLADASQTLEFYYDCYMALKSDPLIFYHRYMSGDDKALTLMVASLNHDFIAFDDHWKQGKNNIRDVYSLSFDQISKQKPPGNTEFALQRHNVFWEISQKKMEEWDVFFKNLQ